MSSVQTKRLLRHTYEYIVLDLKKNMVDPFQVERFVLPGGIPLLIDALLN